MLPTADGGVCVIDWENSGTADPAQELGCVLFEFGRNDQGRARSLAAAYEANGGPARVERRGDFSMLIAQLGHITEIAARDWLVPNPRSPERADSEAWISEVLDEPHTPAVLDGLLAGRQGPMIGGTGSYGARSLRLGSPATRRRATKPLRIRCGWSPTRARSTIRPVR